MSAHSIIFQLIVLCIGLSLGDRAEAQLPVSSPRIDYTDLLSGPANRGEAGEGTIVTLYGRNFGQTQGESSVTLNNEPIHSYLLWSDSKIAIQVGHLARTGPLVVHVKGLPESNGAPFTVRPGNIFFVSPQGNDNHAGNFIRPLKTLLAAKDKANPGDIIYALNGVTQASLDKYDSAFSIQTSGSKGKPIALVSYPGAVVTIGSVAGPQIAARTPNIDRTSDHWVLAGLRFEGNQEALDLTASTDWRIVGNEFTCPKGFGPTGCVETSQATFVAFLGNTIHDVGRPGTTKSYHALYFSTDSNHIDVGWNVIANVRACRGIQFHSSPIGPRTGFNQFDLHVHDNVIHDVVCDGINFATVDPSKGVVEAYNNLIYNVGTGPDPQDGSANYACIYVQGGANVGPPGTGTVDLSNNILYNCGARGNSDSGALTISAGSPQQLVSVRDSTIVVQPGVPLLSPTSVPALLVARDNVFWGSHASAGRLPNGFVEVDPNITAPSANGFMMPRADLAHHGAVLGPGAR